MEILREPQGTLFGSGSLGHRPLMTAAAVLTGKPVPKMFALARLGDEARSKTQLER